MYAYLAEIKCLARVPCFFGTRRQHHGICQSIRLLLEVIIRRGDRQS
jgi:hypothetical protein